MKNKTKRNKTMKNKTMKFLIPLLIISLCANTALAQNLLQSEAKDSSFMIGLGVFSFDSLYVGGKSRTVPFPYLSYQGEHFFFDGGSMGLRYKVNDNLSLSTLITGDYLGDTDRGDSSQLSDMHELKDIVNAGFGVDYHYEYGGINFEVMKDVSSRHKGVSASLAFSATVPLGKWVLIPEIGSSWFSNDISQYYYGVQQNEVLSDRAFYKPDSGFNYNTGLTLIRPITEHHNIALTVSHEIFSNEITNSPIVGKKSLTGFGLFYVYAF